MATTEYPGDVSLLWTPPFPKKSMKNKNLQTTYTREVSIWKYVVAVRDSHKPVYWQTTYSLKDWEPAHGY
jgi:hypothetical protein